MALGITRKAEYAISLLVDLALHKDGFILSKEIAQRQRIPSNLLPQIAAILGKKGWVRGTRGAGGGLQLAMDPARISVEDVIRLIEGPIALNKCLVDEDGCEKRSECPLHGVWAKAQLQMLEVLGGTTIRDLADAKLALTKKEI
ncbi:MAG: RrF2 family transcriptional regulator [Syntrophothermus sp.]